MFCVQLYLFQILICIGSWAIVLLNNFKDANISNLDLKSFLLSVLEELSGLFDQYLW